MATIWDRIHQDHIAGNSHPALQGGILGSFATFVEGHVFNPRTALDIGCGHGKYLKYLEDLGFAVTGIDSSPTAIALARRILSANANLIEADLYTYDIPQNNFGLIFSISAVHHGVKEQVNRAIERIISASSPNGRMFITLPEFPEDALLRRFWRRVRNLINSAKVVSVPGRGQTSDFPPPLRKEIGGDLKRSRYLATWGNRERDGVMWEDLGNGTIVPLSGPEQGLPHSLYTKKEIDRLFRGSRPYEAKRNGGEWIIEVG
jgi:SAM-dependent methyltransferase